MKFSENPAEIAERIPGEGKEEGEGEGRRAEEGNGMREGWREARMEDGGGVAKNFMKGSFSSL
jgi:hypothetical protein